MELQQGNIEEKQQSEKKEWLTPVLTLLGGANTFAKTNYQTSEGNGTPRKLTQGPS